MKICLIGNSHIACIKKAWESVHTKYNSHSITFFGSTADTLLNTRAHQYKLIPTTQQVQNSFHITSNGQEEIDFSLFDLCIVHGVLPILNDWHDLWADLRNIFYSKEFINICINNLIPTAPTPFKPTAKHLIKEITACTAIPLIFSITPNPIQRKKKNPTTNFNFNELLNFMTSVFNVLGVDYILQPEETMNNYFYTKPEFNKNAIGLGGTPTKETKFVGIRDYIHLNASYGEIYLKHIFQRIDMISNPIKNQLHYKMN